LLLGVLLLHDNACPHSAAHTKETLQELKSEALNHPPYSPDLAPSDFHLFGSFKDALRCHQFADDDDEVKEAMHDCIRTQPKTFFYGIRKLVDSWTKCIKKQRNYVEK
jgi:histone-lysine N-methyltransferase SETMAR